MICFVYHQDTSELIFTRHFRMIPRIGECLNETFSQSKKPARVWQVVSVVYAVDAEIEHDVGNFATVLFVKPIPLKFNLSVVK